MCEVQLLSAHTNRIPDDCRTRNIKAKIETWMYIKNNQWIYVLQKPVSITLLCDSSQNHMEDLMLHQIGLLQLQPSCKGYTDNYVLETTGNINKNIIHHAPALDILEDDCCIFNDKLNKSVPIHLTPIKLTNIDLGELRYVNKKLNEFDEIVTKQLNNPFIISHTKWCTIALSCIGFTLVIIVFVNCCKWCGCINWFKRLLCFTRSPRNGEILPPAIKTFINCNFASKLRSEYRNQTSEMVTIDSTRARSQAVEISSDEDIQNTPSPIIERGREDVRPRPKSIHYETRVRHSTTPL
ncbi:hypothetical protein CBL_11616 [Carabus blaptoides fortunei]